MNATKRMRLFQQPARGESCSEGGYLALIFVWLVLFSAFAVQPTFASGDHSESMPVLPGMRLMTFDGFQVELLGSPRPLRLGAENKITVKISRDGSLEAVRDGKVYMGILPPRFLSRSTDSEKNLSAQSDPVDVRLSAVSETVWAGSYTLAPQFDETGPHLVRVVLAELDGKSFDPPAVFDFHLDVVPAAGFTAGFLLLALTAIFIASGGIYWAVVRSRSPVPLSIPFNLLDIPWVNRFVSWQGFQPVLQIPTLVLIAVIAFLGFFDIQDGAKNLATKLTWILWWPGIIFTFILVGRLWCVMCPFGTLNEWAANLS
ncbi:MAG: 4Fe-4S binding protein, partial [Deltaproteobacteria bacterium]|nr:4Fe-4S binding protein [Deltaproteobacteria bacterium]